MAKSHQEKEKIVQELQDNLKRMKGLTFVNFSGLTVKEVNQLRKLLKQQGDQYTVTKKTLLKIAFKNSGLDKIDLDQIAGGFGMIFSFSDELAPIKTVVTFAKNHPNLIIRGGIFNQEFIGAERIKELASLPSKERLLTQIIWDLKSPISNFVYVLRGNLRGLVYVLSRIKSESASRE